MFQTFVPASEEALTILDEAAKQAAVRIRKQGWPEPRFWPPFGSRSRAGAARDSDGSPLPSCQRFRWIDGSGPWLGEDGALYWMSPNGIFRRRSHRLMRNLYDFEWVANVMLRLDALERH